MPHIERVELLAMLDEAKKNVEVGARYAHYKGPDHLYVVTGFVVNEATGDISVTYQREDEDPPISWSRKLIGEDGWLTPLEVDGEKISRFRKA